MYPYITPYDAGRSDEGLDAEDSAELSNLFDDPSDDQTTFDVEVERPFAFDGTGQLIANEQLEQLTFDTAKRLASASASGMGQISVLSQMTTFVKKNALVASIAGSVLLVGLILLLKRKKA